MANIVVLTSRFPYPLEKGDKLRIFYQVKSLGRKHEVHLVALNHEHPDKKQLSALSPYCKRISILILPFYTRIWNLFRALFTGMPFQVSYFYSPSVEKQMHSLIAREQPDAIYCHLIRTSEYVKELKEFSRTIDYMDTFSKGMERRGKVCGAFLKFIINNEYRRLAKYEHDIFNYFNHHVIISGRDREEIPHPDRNRIHVVQNGVDFEEFHPVTREKKYDLLFVGNMGYPPNIEAAYYAATEILPLVHKTRPQVNMLIAGINPPVKIRSLQSDTIRVSGYFEHIRDAFSQSRIMLAPMLISIGLQNKIIQAMAMKIPCIASPLANLAINAPNNTAILVAGSPKEFAETIIFLLDHPKKGNEIAENAWLFVKQNFDWNSQNGELEKILLSKVK